ncbi:MAG TPA: hypothetical protein VFJ30_18785 [Phycisphaerae bacterium]|nr:hypothetical protein [Phycisphaerae bacterium]
MGIAFRVVGLVIAFGAVWLAAGTGDVARTFVNFPMLVLVAMVVAGGLLMSFSALHIWLAVRRSVTGGGEGDLSLLARHLAVLDRARHLAWAGGVIGAAIGVIGFLWVMTEPDKLVIGTGMSLLGILAGPGRHVPLVASARVRPQASLA